MVDDTPLKLELLDADLLDEDRIDAAMKRVDDDGGDLASQLLMTTDVDEGDLLDVLAKLRDVQPADPDDYEHIDPDALATIELPLLLEYSIIPFQMHRRNLGIYVVEPLSDSAIAELSETHDVRITQNIWPRLRYHQTMHALFEQPLPAWANDVSNDLDLTFPDDFDLPSVDDQSLSSVSSPAIGRPIPEATRSPDEVDLTAMGVGWSQDQVLAFIQSCYSRDAVLYALLGYAEWWLENRMIVVLGKDSIQPYLVAGWSELPDQFRDTDRLRQLRVPVDPSAAIFDAEQVGHFLADKPEDVGLGDLFVELTLFPPDRLLNQAVKIGDRPYMLLVGEPHDQIPHVPPGIERLEDVAIRVGEQLEAIIRAAKVDELPPEDQRIPAIADPDGAFESEVGEREEPLSDDGDDDEGDNHVDDDLAEASAPDLQVDASPRSGNTLDGTGESYVEFKDDADEELSAPRLGGSSESESARQTQHIRSDVSEVESDDEAISAPMLDGEEESSRQTQAIPPGMSTSSSVIDEASEAEEVDEPDDDASSTSFGIPFMDAGEDESAADEASTGDEVSSVDETSEPEQQDSPEPEQQDSPEADLDDSSSTMLGGFSVGESSSSVEERMDESSVSGSSESDSVELPPEDEDGPSLGTLDGAPNFAEESSAQQKNIPRSQIVRFISLANGRESLRESSETSGDESDAADGSSEVESDDSLFKESDQLPHIEESSSSLESRSVGFTDEDLQETADLLDSRNPANAFNAAEQIVEWGGRAVKVLSERFPGRLFVDRYEYTPDTMPPAEEHGPVIAALSNLDGRAVSVVEDFLDHTSVELRFYATLLFRELPIDSVRDRLFDRLFDRDKMIRDIAADILLERTDEEFRDNTLRPRLRSEVEDVSEDLRVEVAARLLGQMRDRDAIPALIDALGEVDGKVQSAVHEALKLITYKRLSPSASEWRNWWTTSQEKTRQDWIVEGLNSDSEDVRQMVYHEVQTYEGLDLDYHPEQPKKLRVRAQEQLREWFEEQE